MVKQYAYVPNAGSIKLKNAKDLADPAVAARVGEQLERYRTNLELVHAARSSARNPAHRFFEWDLEKAAMTTWLSQAASLRSCIRFYDTETEEVTRAFIGIREEGEHSHISRYYSPVEVIDNTALQERLLRQWETRLNALIDDMREIEDLCQAAKDLRDMVRSRRAAATGASASR